MCKEELIALVQVSFNLNCDSLRQDEMVQQTLILVCFEYFTVLIFTLHSTELLRIIYVHQHVVCFCEVSAVVNRVSGQGPGWRPAGSVILSDVSPAPSLLTISYIYFFRL